MGGDSGASEALVDVEDDNMLVVIIAPGTVVEVCWLVNDAVVHNCCGESLCVLMCGRAKECCG